MTGSFQVNLHELFWPVIFEKDDFVVGDIKISGKQIFMKILSPRAITRSNIDQ
jgi:hypothetical protein